MVRLPKENEKPIDFSFIPSLECNLHCPFCMYDCSPKNKAELDYDQTRKWLETVDWDLINSWGFYGGEPHINLSLYQKFIDLIPNRLDKFVITNGSWSTDNSKTRSFLSFCEENRLFIIVSGTPDHRRFQNREVLEYFNKNAQGIRLKPEYEQIHPMGRAHYEPWTCMMKCLKYTVPTRLGLFPGGDIVFQYCDGMYPVIQTYYEPFEGILERLKIKFEECRSGKSIKRVGGGIYKRQD